LRAADAFAPDRGLQARMAIALLLNVLVLAALVAFVAWLVVSVDDGWVLVALILMLALAGLAPARGWNRIAGRRHPAPDDSRRVTELVARLAVVADMPVPEVVVEPEIPPLSWTTAVPGRTPRIHVTTGLLDRLPDAELAAVVGHEMSHIGQRDAVLMTVLAAPGILILRGVRTAFEQEGLLHGLGMVLFASVSLPPAAVSGLLARIVSRHRELAADRGAALLTGSPVAMASALSRLSDDLSQIPDRDMRGSASRDLLLVLPAHPEEPRGLSRLWATHPPLDARIRQLERLEAALHA
jgi:heat shock protein HtpX